MTPEEAAAQLDPAKLEAMQRQLMQRIVITVETESKRVTPVRTGNLRRSLTSRVESVTRGVVGTNVIYAPVVHRRKPFFEQGLAASRDTIDQLLADAGAAFFAGVA